MLRQFFRLALHLSIYLILYAILEYYDGFRDRNANHLFDAAL